LVILSILDNIWLGEVYYPIKKRLNESLASELQAKVVPKRLEDLIENGYILNKAFKLVNKIEAYQKDHLELA